MASPRKPDLRKALDLAAPATEEELIGAGAALIRSWHHIEESKTATLKDLAVVIIHLRSKFRTADGDIDWAGHSWEYRQAAARMYNMADVPPDSVAGVQASIRYHIGNALREHVKPKELEAAGLLPTSPKERFQAVRDRLTAIEDAVKVVDLPAGSSGRFVRSVTAARSALEVAAEDIEALASGDKRQPDQEVWWAAAEELGRIVEVTDATLETVRRVLAGTAMADGQAFDASALTEDGPTAT